jgi:hypothetical protein
VIIQTLPSLVVILPSGPAGAIASLALIAFFAASIRARAAFPPQIGAQMLPNPDAKPEHASPKTATVATILFVAGSIREHSVGFGTCHPNRIVGDKNPVSRSTNLHRRRWLQRGKGNLNLLDCRLWQVPFRTRSLRGESPARGHQHQQQRCRHVRERYHFNDFRKSMLRRAPLNSLSEFKRPLHRTPPWSCGAVLCTLRPCNKLLARERVGCDASPYGRL